MRNKIAELEIRVAELERQAGFMDSLKDSFNTVKQVGKNIILFKKIAFKYGVSLQNYRDRYDMFDSMYVIPLIPETKADLEKLYGSQLRDKNNLWHFRGTTAVVTLSSDELYDGKELDDFGGHAFKTLMDGLLRLNGVRK